MRLVYCILSVSHPGGMERVLFNKVNWLSRNGYEIHIVTTDQKGQQPFFPFPDNVVFHDLDINYMDDKHLGVMSKTMGYLKRRKLHRQRLTDLLMSLRPDITISLYPCESSFIPKLKDGSKKVLELHFNRYFRLQYGRKGFMGIIDRMRGVTDKFLVQKFDRFVVLTESDRKNWGNINNIRVISNAVISVKRQCSELTNKRVIAVGRLDYQKGFDRLIDIWHLLIETYPQVADWKLDIFGQGEWKEYLENKIDKYCLKDKVMINNPSNNINEEYAESSILAMTSNYEGFGMVLVEAMSCGVPCVAFDCPCGPSDIIDNGINGLLVTPGDNNAFADALFQLMESSQKRLFMGKNAMVVVDRYSEDKVMAQWMNLFNELCLER